METVKQKQRHSVVKSAIYFAFGTFMSRILGLLRDFLLVRYFDITVTDSYFVAFRFPNLFRRIFGEGALSACFIPLYIEYKDKGDTKALAQLTAGVFGLLMLTLLPFSIIVSLSMDWIIPLWVSGQGFSGVPGKMEMTVTMTKIMFPFLILVSLYAYFMALLNANKKFMLSSMASGLVNVSVIVACLWCYWQNNMSIYVLSWSVIVGGVFQFIVLIPSLRGLKIPFDISWASIKSVPVKRTLNAFLPSVLGLGIIQFMALINSYFASTLTEGAVTHIYLADRLLELPLSLIGVSLGTAMLPSLSEGLKQSDRSLFKKEMLSHIQLLLFLCIPCAVGMWMTAGILVPLLFTTNSVAVIDIVKIYAFTVLTASLARVVSQAFYAGKDTRTPSYAAAFGLVVHLALAPFLMSKFAVNGLVASTAISSLMNCGYLFVVFTLRYGTLNYGGLFKFIAKCAAASVSIVGACWLVLEHIQTDSKWPRILALLLCVGFSGLSYFGLCVLFKVKESQWLMRKLRRKI